MVMEDTRPTARVFFNEPPYFQPDLEPVWLNYLFCPTGSGPVQSGHLVGQYALEQADYE
jgi:hypothetical protein